MLTFGTPPLLRRAFVSSAASTLRRRSRGSARMRSREGSRREQKGAERERVDVEAETERRRRLERSTLTILVFGGCAASATCAIRACRVCLIRDLCYGGVLRSTSDGLYTSHVHMRKCPHCLCERYLFQDYLNSCFP